jgi:hypothetical protein
MDSRESKNDHKEALNVTQKNILEGMFKFIFDSIANLKPKDAIKALKSMSESNISQKDIIIFKQQDVWGEVEQIHKIFVHPCPQNRAESYPYVGQVVNCAAYHICDVNFKELIDSGKSTTNKVYFKNGRVVEQREIIRYLPRNQDFIGLEPEGLLSLTAQEDSRTPSVTKEAVINYIKNLMNQEISYHDDKFIDEEKRSASSVSHSIFSNNTGEIKSLLDSSKNITTKEWTISLAINKQSKKAELYLERIRPNGQFSLQRYGLSTLSGNTSIVVERINPNSFDKNLYQLQTFSIDKIQGNSFIASARDDFKNAAYSCQSYCNASKKKDESLGWATKQLKAIMVDVILDRGSAPDIIEEECTSSGSSCSIQ